MKKLLFILLLCLTVTFALAQSINQLEFYTESYPPYNFEENGSLKGISIEIIAEVLERSNSNKSIKDIKLVPWARGYNALQEKENICLFATTRTEEREDKFKWAGPISKTKISVLGLKSSNIKINSISDLNQYKIGVIRDDVAEQLLLKNNVKKSQIDRVSNNEANIQKLFRGRIDLWAYEENVAKWQTKALNENVANLEVLQVLKEGELYFAFNSNTSDEIIQEFQIILDEMQKDGTIEKILSKY